ncbi:MAG: AAA family ATPase [Pseudomonadota bacterium]
MQVAHIQTENLRGIKEASLFLSKHAVLLGDNNTGKTTVLEALDLTLGPDRLNRTPELPPLPPYQLKSGFAGFSNVRGG